MRILFLLLSFGLMADNEIYINQTGSNVNIDLEQLGSSNIIGGDDAVAGTMTAATLNGGTWTFDINQIGNSNQFLTDGIYGDNYTGYFNFLGDTNVFNYSQDTTGLNGADYVNVDVSVVGSLNDFDWDFGQSSDVSYLDLDFVLVGDSGDFTFDIDSTYYTADLDINGDSTTMTLLKSGYGASSSDAGYFYLDLDGDSNTLNIKQISTLAKDWLSITSNASNSNICVIQNDGGTSTSC